METWKISGAAVLVALFAAGCTTTGAGTGMGMGLSRSGSVAALFSWKQDGARSGLMTASLNTGQIYVGRYFQITPQTRREHGGANAIPITPDSGTVVATLGGPDGQMLCRFRLVRPAGDMSDEGGYCELPNGTTVGATFPPKGWPD